jgi:hypothetical protein
MECQPCRVDNEHPLRRLPAEQADDDQAGLDGLPQPDIIRQDMPEAVP